MNLEKEEISHYFPEMLKVLGDCHFNNCQHQNEPGCAVKKAVAEGVIKMARYESYLDLWHSIEDKKY